MSSQMEPDPPALRSLLDSCPWISHDRQFLAKLNDSYRKESPVFRDVAQLIDSLHLAPFQEAPEPSESESVVLAQEAQSSNGIHKEPEPLKDSPEVPLQVALPKLNKSQRRMSLDLMLMSQKPSLSTLPATSVSGVTVQTKVTDLKAANYRPLNTSAKKSLKSIFAFPKKNVGVNQMSHLTSTRTTRENVAIASQPVVATEAAHVNGSPKKTTVNEAKVDTAKTAPVSQSISVTAPDNPPLLNSKRANRRTSLVGRNLPVYIQEQIRNLNRERQSHRKSSEDSDSHKQAEPELPEPVLEHTSSFSSVKKTDPKPQEIESPRSEDTKSKEPTIESKDRQKNHSVQQSTATTPLTQSFAASSRQDRRISNLLANSSSFYYGNGESQLPDSADDSTVSDVEREYISPDSFTRSIERFGHESYNNSLETQAEENDSSQEEDTDLYLFQ